MHAQGYLISWLGLARGMGIMGRVRHRENSWLGMARGMGMARAALIFDAQGKQLVGYDKGITADVEGLSS